MSSWIWEGHTVNYGGDDSECISWSFASPARNYAFSHHLCMHIRVRAHKTTLAGHVRGIRVHWGLNRHGCSSPRRRGHSQTKWRCQRRQSATLLTHACSLEKVRGTWYRHYLMWEELGIATTWCERNLVSPLLDTHILAYAPQRIIYLTGTRAHLAMRNTPNHNGVRSYMYCTCTCTTVTYVNIHKHM